MYLEDDALRNRVSLPATYNETLKTFKSHYSVVKTFKNLFRVVALGVKAATIGTETNNALAESLKLILNVSNRLFYKDQK